MTTLVIKELKLDRELDHGAMTSVTGGLSRYTAQTVQPKTATLSTLSFWGGTPWGGRGGYGWSYAS